MFNKQITDKDILRMQKEVNEGWVNIESIFVDDDINRLIKLSDHLDGLDIVSLVKRYNKLPPSVLIYVNHFFQTGVAEFLLRVVKKEQLEQTYGDE